MKKTLRAGLIGYKFMGRAHSNAYRQYNAFCGEDVSYELSAVCGRNEQACREFAERFGWESCETDWRKLIERPDIDIIDIAAPPDTHEMIVSEALRAGKHVWCEKPLGLGTEDSRNMSKLAAESGKVCMVGFNSRFIPAAAYAKQLIDEGRIGKIYHFRGRYLQDWIISPDYPAVWRLNKAHAGSGALGDLGSHVIDIARWLVGEIDEVSALSTTFIKERPSEKGMQKVDVDDAFVTALRFKQGALGTIEATRFAQGYKDAMSFEIEGERGSLRFRYENFNELEYLDATEKPELQGFRRIMVTEPSHPYIRFWWPAGHVIGFEHTFTHEAYELARAIVYGDGKYPDFEDGYKCALVMDAVEKSCAEKKNITVK